MHAITMCYGSAMDVRQLRYFLGIVEQGSLSRAAEFLHVAQPALTLHLKRLEDELGCQLVERSSRGVIPTEFGHRLAQRAKALLENLNHLRDEVRGMATAPAGTASVGIPTSLGSILTVPLVMATRERFPLVRLRVAEGLSGHMQDWLLAGLVDLAVVFGDAPLPGLVAQAVMREPLAFIAPRDDTLAAGRTTMNLGDALVLPQRTRGKRSRVAITKGTVRMLSMAASKCASLTSQSHLSLPPAVPMTRQPVILAIWPAMEPVAPAAPDTTTHSPALILPISFIPKYAVSPLSPSKPSARLGSVPGVILCIPPKFLPSVTT